MYQGIEFWDYFHTALNCLMLTQFGCKRLKSCDLEQVWFFFWWENRCVVEFSFALWPKHFLCWSWRTCFPQIPFHSLSFGISLSLPVLGWPFHIFCLRSCTEVCVIWNQTDLMVNAFNYGFINPRWKEWQGKKAFPGWSWQEYLQPSELLVAFPGSFYSDLGMFHCSQKQL